jgi:isopentenyl-diphosphate Delta-isomerase
VDLGWTLVVVQTHYVWNGGGCPRGEVRAQRRHHRPFGLNGVVEEVVLLDPGGQAVGTAGKASVHHDQTPLHLAFSCYLFNEAGQLLLTRRAESKRVFPGVWTNSCCGHPGPGEAVPGAVRRRLAQELGIAISSPTLLLPRFRYQARMDQIVENEMCPVYSARADTRLHDLDPDPAEVAEVKWVGWDDFREQVLAGQQQVSPWCALQVAELDRLGPDPLSWPAADPSELPPAAWRHGG